jgi:CPA1 family monovalent cation:H+ antiporter
VAGFRIILALTLGSAICALLAKKVRIPAPVVTVLGGIAAAFVPKVRDVALDPDLAFAIFVPPLLYRAALMTSVRGIRERLRPILLLAVGLILLTMGVVALVAHEALGMLGWPAAFVLGAIVAPPDAIIAIALVRSLRAPRIIVTLVEGEGLLNDTTAFVVYAQAVGAAVTGRFSLARAVPQFFLVALGGAAFGWVVAFVVTRSAKFVKDPVVANVIWLLTPFAAFLPAEAVHASGVLAVVVAGVLLRRSVALQVDAQTRVHGTDVYDILEFVLNGLMFILIGMEVGRILRDSAGPPLHTLLRATGIVTAAVVVTRFAWMFPAAYLPRWLSARIRKREGMPTVAGVTLLAWMGMRGGDSLVTALALPRTIATGAPFPARDLIVATTFGVILATMLLQGLTIGPLIKWLHFPPDRSLESELALARRHMAAAGETWLDGVARDGKTSPAIVGQLRRIYARRTDFELDLAADGEDREAAEAYRRVEQELLAERRKAAVTLRNESTIDDETLRVIERELDFEELRLLRDEAEGA